MQKETIYQPEKETEHLSLTKEQKQVVGGITLGMEEVDQRAHDMDDDVVETLENGHPLNKLITGENNEVLGYVACEDFVSGEAYIKYFGSTENLKTNLFKELPAFFEYAKQKGYSKLNFHGWNKRLNHALERFGFEHLRTDSMDDISADFYEKALTKEKDKKTIAEERKKAFEQKYINKIKKEYERTLKTFREEDQQQKEQQISEAFETLNKRLISNEDFEIKEKQEVILKLKLARYFQSNETCDTSTLYDAIVETSKFINTDKGSLNHLFEIHEQKTLEKIAQIRKQRAEMSNEEGFNPYEALLRTDSKEYYLARLLNMPHLEEESEYMRNCVGTSDSYINQMKRGEIEILSLRHTKEGGQGEPDAPIMTIEYDPKEKVIKQMKTANDEYLRKDDPYYHEVIDALKKLTQTTTDIGEKREIKEISKSELENIEVKDYHFLTEDGEVDFHDFDPDSGIFVLKTGKMDINQDIPKQDAAKILKIVEDIEVEPQEIACGIDEINKNTKAYIGEWNPQIYQEIRKYLNIEHLYESFPDKKIFMQTLETDPGINSPETAEKALEDENIYLTNRAKDILKQTEFSKEKQNYELVRFTVEQLGLPNGVTIKEIREKLEELKLELCQAEVGPQLRLKYPGKEWLFIAMEPITGSDGDPGVFYLHEDVGRLELDADDARPGSRWDAGCRFVFRPRKLDS
ncbi:hypothetical protein HOD96_02930 [Candidatus Falkowbacteria bacterium]|jgi:hypothetical protein|nr:hypothetical protein [Candidatus Falkowbacteria bacterium]MBT4432784.1 hypothetical protein [Candidatus Falkowbacteria bacterium]